MTTARLPTSVTAFLRTHVDHIVKLKFLLVLHSAPSSTVSVPMVARTLDIPKAQIRDMANELVEAGLLRISLDQLELSPRSIEDRLAIADLASWYARDRNLVLNVLRTLGRFT